MKKIIKKVKKQGQSLVEYGLILALLSIVCITVLSNMGQTWKDFVNSLNNKLENANERSQAGW